jgi:hypothetical protein
MSASIPTAVLSQQLRSLLDGRKVIAAVFMAFTFEPEFFEQEVMTLLAGDDLSQEPKLRLLQLQELLRADIGPVAVYYDQSGLRPDGPARLDIRYIPVRVRTGGLFHPKVVLLLTDPLDAESADPTTLLFGVMSANLTKGGWWSNLECVHFESIKPGDRLGFHDDLTRLLRETRVLSTREAGHEPLDRIHTWLRRETTQTSHATWEGRLRTRLVAGTRPFLEFISEARSDTLAGCSLEVISPFFDERDPGPLRRLVEQLDIRETRVFLPTMPDGRPTCAEEFFDAVRAIPNADWARLPEPLLRIGKDANAKPRGVHAKVYRFFKRSARYEALVVGSHNLTTAAHQKGGNFEASLLIERDDAGVPDWWLDVQKKKPTAFAPDAATIDDDISEREFVPLQLTFDWMTKRAEARWDGAAVSNLLKISSSGSDLFTLESLQPGTWTVLSPENAAILETGLASTSIFTVSKDGSAGTILVQESGMSRKPSIVVAFSIADILEYWSRLTPADRASYLEAHFQSTIPDDWSVGDIVRREAGEVSSFFENFAGIFHGFEMLRTQMADCLSEGNEKKADYLLFGKRHDSLPHMVEKAHSPDQANPLSRYLVLLCARQLLHEMRRGDTSFFIERRADIDALLDTTLNTEDLLGGLTLGEGGPKFIKWFEGHFLKRLKAPAVQVDA